ncbi:hypothetical protein A6302_01741 [Methylobrevis pamukkalensis]|uniref:Uncharacterized protein n=1 Tax=Methylobrevis pamukkalensis TaxID=1439726 RepID=A0A1E3H3H6_9HYPH|nr:hypothetical protein A6302_01741 [Methylobrevis pamukkalensis]
MRTQPGADPLVVDLQAHVGQAEQAHRRPFVFEDVRSVGVVGDASHQVWRAIPPKFVEVVCRRRLDRRLVEDEFRQRVGVGVARGVGGAPGERVGVVVDDQQRHEIGRHLPIGIGLAAAGVGHADNEALAVGHPPAVDRRRQPHLAAAAAVLVALDPGAAGGDDVEVLPRALVVHRHLQPVVIAAVDHHASGKAPAAGEKLAHLRAQQDDGGDSRGGQPPDPAPQTRHRSGPSPAAPACG